MNCKQVRELVAGEHIADPHRAPVQEHVDGCVACATWQQTLERTDIAVREAVRPDDALADRLADHALAAAPVRENSWLDQLVSLAWPATAVAVTAAVLALMLIRAPEAPATNSPQAPSLVLPDVLNDPALAIVGGEK